ncbi:MAG: hypothetical protein ACE37E_00495 [Hyphomicrobiales bacterium]
MTDHLTDTTALTVALNASDLTRAARLGGLPMPLKDTLADDPDLSIELVRLFAKRGITHAIRDSFNRAYPARYPEDVPPTIWEVESEIAYVCEQVRRGTAS